MAAAAVDGGAADVAGIVDARLGRNCNVEDVFDMAFRCVRPYKNDRPRMKEVLAVLRRVLAGRRSPQRWQPRRYCLNFQPNRAAQASSGRTRRRSVIRPSPGRHLAASRRIPCKSRPNGSGCLCFACNCCFDFYPGSKVKSTKANKLMTAEAQALEEDGGGSDEEDRGDAAFSDALEEDEEDRGDAAFSSHRIGFVIKYGLTFFFAYFGPNSTTFIVPAVVFVPLHRLVLVPFVSLQRKASMIETPALLIVPPDDHRGLNKEAGKPPATSPLPLVTAANGGWCRCHR